MYPRIAQRYLHAGRLIPATPSMAIPFGGLANPSGSFTICP
jgi:hypothetical protein